MEIFTILAFIVLIILVLFFTYLNIKYFINMWKYKKRKKDGSEDKDFKMFD